MCGIIAVVRRPSDRAPADGAAVRARLQEAVTAAEGLDPGQPGVDLATALDLAAERLQTADRLLRGVPGTRSLLADRRLGPTAVGLVTQVEAAAATVEAALDDPPDVGWSSTETEQVNAALIRLKDAGWAIRRDRIPTAAAVAALAGADAGPAAVEAMFSVQQALSALDRLEVRGRDSAGLQLLVCDHGLDLDAPDVAHILDGRDGDPLFRSSAVRCPEGHLAFVYKAAAEIGELGDNTAALREAITEDRLLRRALQSPEAQLLVLGHTRWASVGIISEPNAHPLDADEIDGVARPYVAAVLNGDVDNFADLKADDGLAIADEITTDAKVIPTLMARRLDDGRDLDEAFRHTVARLEGSVAIAAANAVDPNRLHLALRGSGQALYVGLADDAFVVASEPYGLIEETDTYLRLDGETPANAENPTASRGQIVVLDGTRAGTIGGIMRRSYDGTDLPVGESDLETAQITTRDINRGDSPHFLLKEISEAPSSFRKTLRGKLVERDGGPAVELGEEVLSERLRDRLARGEIRRVVVIGQGTAAIAGQSLAQALAAFTPTTDLRVDARPATELSGFGLAVDMADTLVIAISQSGTTTDTNRTVDLARSRGAPVVAIVNRRNSDLTDKADGVLYTSDGRDVEMSVASTKAFYAQVAAGFVLAVALADAVGAPVDDDRAALLEALRVLPEAMEATIATRAEIGRVARELAPSRRYWAIVGNGPNRVAAKEVRIKLSELCYKSIACDTTEDKKHIDLSAEPLILVCAAGLSGSNADDVAKEVAIYRAHKAAPIVVATEGEGRFSAALHALTVPATHPQLSFVLSAMVGHLFGYEAALAIDDQARPLREARAAIEQAVTADTMPSGDALVATLLPVFEPLAAQFLADLRAGDLNGHLEASTATRVASMFRYVLGVTPLDSYQAEYGKVGTPAVVIEDLTAALTRAIEELTRPIDAIKHQAKTVTVGISRTDETLLHVPLVAETLTAGAPRDRLTYRTLRTLADLDPAVDEVVGFSRYRIEGRPESGAATIVSIDTGGIARGFPSRTDRNPHLRGTKNRVATEGTVLAARGRSDGRTILLVPEMKDGVATGITLLHVRFADRLSVAAARGVLQGYRNRYAAVRDAVTETEPTFRDDRLAETAVVDLLTEPVSDLADRWRTDGSA
jgi:glucosamine--fructose-6-phosphate aminotransferase (isomerizing)